MSEDRLQLITPFGPSIAKVKIPEKILKTLNDHVDKTRASKKMSEKCIYVDKNCIKCNNRAWFPLIHSRYCFKHRKIKDPYQLIFQNKCKKDEFIPLLKN